MTTRTYPLGEKITFTTTFVDPQSNQPKNPNAVVFRILDPNNVESRPAVINVATGVFTSQWTPTISGEWHTRWECTGTIQTASEHTFEVNPSAFSAGS